MKKAMILIAVHICAAIATAPVNAQEKTDGVRQPRNWQRTKLSPASTGISTPGKPGYGRSGYASLSRAGGQAGGDAQDGESSQRQPNESGFAVSPLLGAPRDYEDSYQAAVGGQSRFDANATHQSGNYGLTPEEWMLAREYVSSGGRSATINALGVNNISDEAGAMSKKRLAGKTGVTNRRSLSVYDFGYAGYTNTNRSLTGTQLYRSPW